MQIEQLLKALGEPTRFKMYGCLLERKHCVGSLAEKLGISESAVSQHLKLMREAGLIYSERFGYHTHYLPSQEAADLLAGSFLDFQNKSRALDREDEKCQCILTYRGA